MAPGGGTASGASGSGALDHMRLAYDLAHAADPGAVLFLNDYNLETNPKKRATFLGLAEALLKAGAPLGGLGTQTHVPADLGPGAITETLKRSRQPRPEGAGLGDGRLSRPHAWFGSFNRRLSRRQAAIYHEAAEAFTALPLRQRADFTFWGLKDSQSWLRRTNAWDAPLLFDDQGHPKFAAAAWEVALRRTP